ncbi:MAG: thioredoxin family protein [Candidatus Diapherotrites archaeon]|uniref:Thioredoxin family protein n=1 Tax=Candidatus Iainarchaeum sp. TaxID=3101447 RepID=A0A8T3YLC0_9ARCH|nr:thioredoxin family protein [Candidatus Diapherotrites archaeon]
MTITPSGYSVLREGNTAPDFSLPGIDGKTHSLMETKGAKATLVIFMCNHCPFVKPKMPYLRAIHEKYAGKGLAMFAINSNDQNAYPEDDFAHMKETAKAQGFSFPYLLDESQEVARAYGAACTPDPFLFDAGFGLVYHGRIDDAHKEPHEKAKTNELEEAVKQVLAGKEVTVKEEPSYGCNVKWKA